MSIKRDANDIWKPLNEVMKRLMYIIIVVLVGCTSSKSELDFALEQSGDNRKELEQVLLHYSIKEADSLHLKAAQFLITHMPGHYSWKSKELGNYRNYMDSIYPEMSSVVKKVVYSIPWHSNQLSLDKGMMLEDIKTIKADFLIRHIDNAINMWQQSPWLRDVTFENFCEYLLPYRVGDEPLIDMDSTLYWWKEVKQEMDVYSFTPLFLDEIRHFLKNKIGESDNRYFTNLDFGKNISRKYTMDCLDMLL